MEWKRGHDNSSLRSNLRESDGIMSRNRRWMALRDWLAWSIDCVRLGGTATAEEVEETMTLIG